MEIKERPKRTTLAVNEPFADKVADLARGHGMSIADYCDQHLDAVVTSKWRALFTRKLAQLDDAPDAANELEAGD
jgi:hypothetical protein